MKIIVSISIILLILAGCQNLSDYNDSDNIDYIIYEKNEVWGPCSPDNICNQNLKLYDSGMLILFGVENGEEIINKASLNNIKNLIVSSNILDKDCATTPGPLDYDVNYAISYEDSKRNFKYGECYEELELINTLIDNSI